MAVGVNRTIGRENGDPTMFELPIKSQESAVGRPDGFERLNGQATPDEAGAPVALESVLCTDELNLRPSRSPDYESENRALVALAQALADSPSTILQRMAEIILETFRADSAGVSLLTKEDGGKRFFWPAIAGIWKPHIGGGTPRNFGPCGDVLDRNAPLLFKHFERRYTYFLPVTPPVEECLLVPFYVDGKAVGTIWAISHNECRKFDNEDLRQLVSLGTFASSAYQAQEQTAALADLDRRKDEFLAMLGHELRNPLAPLLNAAQMLQLQRDEDGLQQQARTIIERQLGQMVHLVDDLLEMSRISTGRIHLNRGQVDMRTIVEHGIGTVRSLIEERRQVLAVQLPSSPTWVDGDATRLEQVVVNLLNNAAKYTNEAGHIWLSLHQEGTGAVLKVRDSGVGIAPELMPHIFDLFTQAERSLSRSQGGLGIGLCLVQRLVEMHGGTVAASSALRQGSEFIVRLPMVLVSTLPPPSVTETIQPTNLSLRVLVVDDNVDTAKSLAVLLRRSGHDVRTAHDGPTALDVALDYRPDVVLLDIGLPGLDGYEAAKRLRMQPVLENAVLVAVTGYGQETDRQRSQEAGFAHHLVKPVHFKKVREILASCGAAECCRSRHRHQNMILAADDGCAPSLVRLAVVQGAISPI
jgi:signal transduction histidine kinase/CheY-like chemotaxis protein